MADPLYHLLRKGKKFEWKPEHTKAMKKFKKTLRRAEALKKPSYDRPIIVTVDTTVGSRVGDKIGSGLFDRIRSSDRDGLSSDTRDDAVLYDTGCGYAKVDCIYQIA